MFVTFFHALKRAGLPVSLNEYLTLLEGLEAGVTGRQVEDFYFLSRASLVKDERNLDRFDRVFGEVFKGLAALPDAIEAEIPEEWLRLVSELHLSEEDKRAHRRTRRLGKNHGDAVASASKSRRSVTRAATNGSAPAARHPSARTVTILPAYASARRRADTGAR